MHRPSGARVLRVSSPSALHLPHCRTRASGLSRFLCHRMCFDNAVLLSVCIYVGFVGGSAPCVAILVTGVLPRVLMSACCSAGACCRLKWRRVHPHPCLGSAWVRPVGAPRAARHYVCLRCAHAPARACAFPQARWVFGWAEGKHAVPCCPKRAPACPCPGLRAFCSGMGPRPCI